VPCAFAAINWPQGEQRDDESMAEARLGRDPRLAMALGGPGSAAAQTKPEGEMRFALYVTDAGPAGPGEAVLGNLTPFWMLTRCTTRW